MRIETKGRIRQRQTTAPRMLCGTGTHGTWTQRERTPRTATTLARISTDRWREGVARWRRKHLCTAVRLRAPQLEEADDNEEVDDLARVALDVEMNGYATVGDGAVTCAGGARQLRPVCAHPSLFGRPCVLNGGWGEEGAEGAEDGEGRWRLRPGSGELPISQLNV